MSSKCFFCLKIPDSLRRSENNKSGNGGFRPTIKLLLNYLLEIGSTRGGANQSVLESVLSLLEERNDDGILLQFCEKCESLGASLSELHLQLEVIQMKIVSLVETIRNGVLNSKIRVSDCVPNENEGGNVGEGESHEERGIRGDIFNERERRLMEVIQSFQNAVAKGRSPIQVPSVLLEKCFRIPKISNNLLPNVDEVKVEPLDPLEEPLISNDLVKTELEYSGEDNFVDSPPSPLSNSGDVDDDYEPPTKRRLKKRVERKTKENDSGLKLSSKTAPFSRKRKKAKQKQPRKQVVCKRRQWVSRKYICDTCESFTTTHFQYFKLHLEKHETGEKLFQCTACPDNLWLSGQQLYDLHQECHLGNHMPECEFCEEKVDIFFLKDHMKTCSKGPSPLQLFPCVNCSFCTSNRENLLEHLRYHSGLREAKLYKAPRFVCDLCSEELPNRNMLLEHLFQVHSAIQKLECSYPGCEMSFLDKHKLSIHEKKHLRKFVCRHCQQVLSSAASLGTHELLHTGDRPFPCPECGEGFRTKLHRQRHLINVHNAAKFKCEVCGNEYTDMSTLKSHMRIHTGATFPCEHCGVHFVTKTQLLRHVETHGTQKNFVCEECGMSFLTNPSLAKHRQRHSTEKRFKCEICDKTFKQKKYLYHHRRTHTGERPFVCDRCGATFPRKGSLNFHKKTSCT